MIEKRIRVGLYDLKIMPTDIIPLVNKARYVSFGCVRKNKNTISKRVWFPYNRNLLLHSAIQSSMTLGVIEEEKQLETMNSTSILNGNAKILTSTLSPTSQLIDPSFEDNQVLITTDLIQLKFNFKTKPEAVVLGAIIHEEGILAARQQNAFLFKKGGL